MKIMETKKLSFTYEDGTEALKNIDFSLEKGETTAILGSNGAGKSSLFLNLNGIYTPSGGEVLYQGERLRYDRKSLKALRSKLAFVFQDPDDQIFSANVYQDISFGVMNMKLPLTEVKRRVDAAMERTDISHLKEKPTHALSFGQKKRVAIAGALVMEPEILILDEPTAGLDPGGVSDLMRLLQDIQKEQGLTLAIATHDIDMIPLYCDKIYLLDQGEMVLSGSPAEVFSHADIIRAKKLRLPRIAHLMEILAKEDGFPLDELPLTIAAARKAIKSHCQWRE